MSIEMCVLSNEKCDNGYLKNFERVNTYVSKDCQNTELTN